MGSIMGMNKLDNLAHYVCARCDNPTLLGATKLNKILWHSDLIRFAQAGHSITGAVYVKRQFGPVPKDILNSRARLAKAGAIVERSDLTRGYAPVQFVALRPADISMFSADEISVVDSVLDDVCFRHTATSTSEISHDVVWEAAEIGEEIPMPAAAFAGQIGEIDEHDVAWARQAIDAMKADEMV